MTRALMDVNSFPSGSLLTVALWQELPAAPGGSLACAGGLAGAYSLSGAGGLVGVVLSLSGTVSGLVYLGDGIVHLFLTLRSLQVFFSSCYLPTSVTSSQQFPRSIQDDQDVEIPRRQN